MAKPLSEAELRRVYHHTFLPPELPQASDDTTDVNIHLINVTIEALRAYKQLLPNESPSSLENAIVAIQNLKAINSLEHGATSESELLRVLSALCDGQSAPMRIRQQNAAVLVTKKEDELVFETFELSPLNSAVISVRGRLTRCFPGATVAVNIQDHPELLSVIAETLTTMSHGEMPGMQPESTKAGAKHGEYRNTTNPAAVTELFVGFLRGYGRPVLTSGISKNTRDEVLWTDALVPWRRSPMWLLIKVTLHLLLSRASQGSDRMYKGVMIFVLGQIVDMARECLAPSDCLYAMSAKIVRRLHKLRCSEQPGVAQPEKLLSWVDDVLQRTSVMISGRWRKIQKKDTRSLNVNVLPRVDIRRDTQVPLPALDDYIASMQLRSKATHLRNFIPTAPLIQYEPSTLPSLSETAWQDYHRTTANLQHFEQWVQQNLDAWLSAKSELIPHACRKLYNLMTQYHDLASKHYSRNPEGISVMILTIFELWVACDQVAIHKCQMLSEYAPDIPLDALQSLLLPQAKQMERLSKLEAYLQDRASNSCGQFDAMLFRTDDKHSFPARYFAASEAHQALRKSIECAALEARQAKEEEFHAMQSEYERLDLWYEESECEYREFVIDDWCTPPETELRHMKSICKKCKYRTDRDSLTIEVHEWPLPESLVESSVVVFELKVPSWYSSWRDCRSYLLQNVLHGNGDSPSPRAEYLLRNDPHLASEYTGRQLADKRIRLLSEEKPQVNTHYHMKGIATLDVSTVCVKNGTRYLYHDKKTQRFVGNLVFDNDAVARSCTYTLSVSGLQAYVFRPATVSNGQPPNASIASQGACPDSMSLEEYKELSGVPSGHRIQWANILLQLAMPGVDFRKEVTTLVFWQCIYQTGPPGEDVLRQAHEIFESDSKAFDMITHLDLAVERIKRNWESVQALSLFASIATRVLCLNPATKSVCFPLLAKIRNIAMAWMHTLRDLAYDVRNHEERTLFTSEGVEVALVCASTYDLQDDHMAEMLSPASEASTLVQACIVIQQGDSAQSWEQHYHRLLRLRFVRLMHRCYKILAHHHDALDDAIKRAWSAYTPCVYGWKVASSQADHWVMTETHGLRGTIMLVRYDLLSGELLVNGLPVYQPPPEYHTQPLYKTLFGTATVEVMPATSKGFRFSTKRAFKEHEVQLGMLPGSNKLLVQALHEDEVIEVVPSEVFARDLPQHFVEDYVHWYSSTTRNVEFRPSDDPWNASSSASWTLKKVRGSKWQLIKSGNTVVGLQTPTAAAVAKILSPLTTARRTHCVLQNHDQSLRVDVPLLRLGFSLGKGDSLLRSKEFPSMCIDERQELGTLVGFKNKLMLKAKNGDRLLLLAEAKVAYAREGARVSVHVSSTDAIHTVHPIRIDPLLRRLVDNGNLGCKYYLAYLHALTSFCLPDRLTHTTGTEQALAILDSSAARSFERLSQANVNMLASIARLCPERNYYPANKQEMQSVRWNPKLSFLVQHARLRLSVKAIFDQAENSEFYYTDNKVHLHRLPQVDEHLQQRDSIRSSTFRVPGFGAEDFTLNYDRDHDARDRNLSQRGKNAALMCGLMTRHGASLHWPFPASGSIWLILHELKLVHGQDVALGQKKYRYDGALVLPREFDHVFANLPVHHEKLASCWGKDELCSVAVWLATLAFADNANMELLQVLAMLCRARNNFPYRAPSAMTFELLGGKTCTHNLLRNIISKHALPFEVCPEATLVRNINEQLKPYTSRRHAAWDIARREAVDSLAHALTYQWPCPIPVTPMVAGVTSHVNVAAAMKAVQVKFQLWHNNKLLHEYLEDITRSLMNLNMRSVRLAPLVGAPAPQRPYPQGHFAVEDIFSMPAPSFSHDSPQPVFPRFSSANKKQVTTAEQSRLDRMLETLDSTIGRSQYEKNYVSDLKKSRNALVSQREHQSFDADLTSEVFVKYRDQCQKYAESIYDQILASIYSLANSSGERTVQHFPRVSPSLLLRHLAHSRTFELSEAWKTAVIDYGLALTALQRAERLVYLRETLEKDLRKQNHPMKSEDAARSTRDSQPVDLLNELNNPGHTNWNPYDRPEYLLMEIESGIMIRKVQQQIASRMESPESEGNAVMQLNMGEGKSTVIIPMVAAALANGKQLVRVVVAKPQSKQMAEMLIAKFGGLLGRRIYYMPFSRSLKLDKSAAETMLEVLKQCRRTGGILLVQPEHILSFRLMAPESYIAGKDSVGKTLMATQDFFDKHSRDIVDESDENFSVKFELIYTMGTQQPIELSPDRWFLMQQILDLVQKIAPSVARTHPTSIEIHHGNTGGFPRIRLLRADATRLLMLGVAAHIRDNGLGGVQMSRQSEKMRNEIYTYITDLDLCEETTQFVEGGELWKSFQTPILLLRGILAGGVLAFVLGQKRWRVNYGLASRKPSTKLAVPYRAKDSPSLRSEFSHPDVVITLTSLCYYYEGLNDDDMFTAFGHLMSSDQADMEYQAWVNCAPNVPLAFKQLQGVNLKDRLQCVSQVFPSLRFGKASVDYFLSHIVFPKEMKQYPHKLTSSGWDIGKKKALVTTGFSGTNDSRRLLPLFVKQLDLDQQLHTNALVLEYLLQPVNDVELMPPITGDDNISDAERLLATVLQLDPPVQVILDVGAQILELDNLGVAQAWLLQSNHGKEAVVFVNNSDELCVVDRKGHVDLLQTSSYVSRLDVCLIFLDESHTRGIDLKMPSTYRAAVTLGAHLTKDRLVQACMRMRKLGQGQTVVFCISQEIQFKILSVRHKRGNSDITVEDVLLWSMSETHAETRRSMPLWTVQGERFVRQEQVWKGILKDGETSLSKVHAEKLLDEEAQSIDHRYRPRKNVDHPDQLAKSSNVDLKQISHRCRDFNGLSFNSSTLQEEQERELSPETEQEREVPKPKSAKPAAHTLHKDVVKFALSGTINEKSKAYMPAFDSLKGTSASKVFPVSQLAGHGQLLVTVDFATTIQHGSSAFSSDTFQRPVQWLLTKSSGDTREVEVLMVISPFEANALLPDISNASIAMHLYKPRCNSGYDPLDKIDLFTLSSNTTAPKLPRSLSVQLSLFAGQLYISSYNDYLEICRFLGLSTTLVTSEMEQQGWKVATDGFIQSDGTGKTGGSSGLKQSPVGFFKVFMSKIRRNGDGISKTDMGHLLEGKPFQKSHWKAEDQTDGDRMEIG
jgi:hypothetical protein